MNRLTLALPAIMLAIPAYAADPVYSEPAPMAEAPVASTWTGFYAGVQGGYGFGETGQIQLNPFVNPALIAAFTPQGQPNGSSFNANGDFNDGFVGGAHIGYDWQAGNIVFGGILDVSYTDLGDEQRAFSRSPAEYIIERELDFLATLRARIGYAFGDRFLAYGTGGLAYGNVDLSYRQGILSPGTPTPFGDQDSDFGYTVGGGVEARVTQNWSVGLEYLYTNLGGNDFGANLVNTVANTGPFGNAGTAGTNLTGTDDDFDFHTIQLKLSYRF